MTPPVTNWGSTQDSTLSVYNRDTLRLQLAPEVAMFDVRLSEEQRQFQKLARDFAQNEIKPRAMPLDREPDWEKRVPWDLLKKGSQLGFRTFVLSEENGGSGMSDQLTSCLVAEEIG